MVILLYIWVVSIVAGFFLQGYAGWWFDSRGLVPPALIAIFWPFFLIGLSLALPFLISFGIGRLIAGRRS